MGGLRIPQINSEDAVDFIEELIHPVDGDNIQLDFEEALLQVLVEGNMEINLIYGTESTDDEEFTFQMQDIDAIVGDEDEYEQLIGIGELSQTDEECEWEDTISIQNSRGSEEYDMYDDYNYCENFNSPIIILLMIIVFLTTVLVQLGIDLFIKWSYDTMSRQ